MTTLAIVSSVACIVVAAFVLYVFGFARRRAASTPPTDVQEATLLLRIGFEPQVLVFERGRPAKIRVIRSGDSPATAELTIPAFSIVRKLPPRKTTTIDLDPVEAGSFEVRSGGGIAPAFIVVLPDK